MGKRAIFIIAILMLLASVMGASAVIPCGNFTGQKAFCFSFDEGTGTSVADSSGNNYAPGTLVNTMTFSTDSTVGPYSAKTVGTTSAIALGTNASTLINTIGSSAFTIALWYRTDNTTTSASIMSAEGTGGNRFTVTFTTGGAINFGYTGGAGCFLYSNTSFWDQRWHRVVITRPAILSGSTNTSYMYVDGVLENSTSCPAMGGATSPGFRLGQTAGGSAGAYPSYYDQFLIINGTSWNQTTITRDYWEGYLFLNVLDEQTNANIAAANITVENSTNTIQTTASNGRAIIKDVADGTRFVKVQAAGYSDRNYYVSTGRSSPFNTYLLSNTVGSLTAFTVREPTEGNAVENVSLSIQNQLSNGTWATIAQAITDGFGTATYSLQPGHTYQFIVDPVDYPDKTGVLTIANSAYVITLSAPNTQNFTNYYSDFTYSVVPSEVSPVVTNFSITVSSPDGRAEWFAVTTLVGGVYSTTNVTGSPAGGTASQVVNLSAYNGQTVRVWYYAKGTSSSVPLVLEKAFYVYGQDEQTYTFSSFMRYYGPKDNPADDKLSDTTRVFLLVLVAGVGLVLLGPLLGVEAGMFFAGVVFIIGGIYSWMHWTLVIVTAGALIGGAWLRLRR